MIPAVLVVEKILTFSQGHESLDIESSTREQAVRPMTARGRSQLELG